jgi:putative hydrolase of the HAD superfamily
MSLPPDVRAVVIDLYDTLVYVALPPKEEQLTTLLGVSEDVLMRGFAATGPTRWAGGYGSADADMAATVKACGLEHEGAFIRELTARNIAAWAGRTCWFDDAVPVLTELRARGYRTAVISNCDHRTRPAVALADYVDAVILSVDVRVAKPQAEIYAMALERLDVEPTRAVFVDDHVEYCAGAKAIGMSAFLIDRAGRHACPPPGADGVIRGLRELL